MLFSSGPISSAPISAESDESIEVTILVFIKDIPVEVSPFNSIATSKILKWIVGCENGSLWDFSTESTCSTS